MIVKNFYISDLDLRYLVGINQIRIDYEEIIENNQLEDEEEFINYIFNVINIVQKNYSGVTLQFLDSENLLDDNHLFTATYFTEKAFQSSTLISKSKNIELLLYLSTNRQIKKALQTFGLNKNNIKTNSLTYVIVSHQNNIKEVNQDILINFQGASEQIIFNLRTLEKFNHIKNYYKFSDNQINSVLKSYNFNSIEAIDEKENIAILFTVLHDLLCEKMALLSLEKIKAD